MTRDFLPYGRQSVDDADVAAVTDVLRSDALTTGPVLPRFEAELARRVGASWSVAVNSGTSALHSACFAAGVGPGDEVVVPAITFLATANCARYLGGEPVFADVDPDTGLMRLDAMEHRLGGNTKAVIPVHLTGVAADVAGIAERLAPTAAVIIEDGAHALGAARGDEPVGSCRHSAMTIFSFHPIKTITCAEGGAVTGNDPDLLGRLRRFRNHGIERTGPWSYEQHDLGFNYRLSEVHAALGLSQLGKLRRFVDRRAHLARRYTEGLAALGGELPVTPVASSPGSAHHLFTVLVDFEQLGVRRSDVMEWLRERGIGTQVHYIPLPMQPYYRDRGWSADAFPGAMAYYERALSLPLFPAMVDDDVDRVITALHEALRRTPKG